MANILRFFLTADNKAVLRSIRETGTASQETAHRMVRGDMEVRTANEETALSFERMRSGVGLLVGAVGLGGLAIGLKDVVGAGMKWQTQQASLQSALRSTGHFSTATMKAINASTASLATRGGFSEDAQIAAITQFLGVTKNVAQAQKANVAATNLARSGLVDYSKAVNMIAMAQAGNARGLQKYVGTVIPVTTAVANLSSAQKKLEPGLLKAAQLWDKQQTAIEINRLVMDKYGGRTAVYNRTFSGMMSNLGNLIGIIERKIGVALLPMLMKVGRAALTVVGWIEGNWPKIRGVIVAAFSPLVKVFNWLGGIKAWLVYIGLSLAAFAGYSVAIRGIAVATALWGAATEALAVYEAYASVGMGGLTAAMAAFTAVTDLNPLVLAFVALVVVITLVVTHFQWFKTAVSNVFKFVSSVVTSAVNWISQKFNMLVGIFKPIVAQIAAVLLWPFKNIIEPVWNAIYKNVFKPIIDGVKWLIGAAKTVANFFGGFLGGSQPAAERRAQASLTSGSGFVTGRAATLPVPNFSAGGSGTDNSLSASKHRATADAGGTVHVHVHLDRRQIAEALVNYGQRRHALS